MKCIKLTKGVVLKRMGKLGKSIKSIHHTLVQTEFLLAIFGRWGSCNGFSYQHWLNVDVGTLAMAMWSKIMCETVNNAGNKFTYKFYTVLVFILKL